MWQATNKPADTFAQVEEYADTIRQAVVCFTGHLPSVCCPALLVMNFRQYVVNLAAPRVETSVALCRRSTRRGGGIKAAKGWAAVGPRVRDT